MRWSAELYILLQATVKATTQWQICLLRHRCRAATLKKAKRGTNKTHKLLKAQELVYLDPAAYLGNGKEIAEQVTSVLLASSKCSTRSNLVLKLNKISELRKEIWVNTFHILELLTAFSCSVGQLVFIGLIKVKFWPSDRLESVELLSLRVR